MSNKPDFQVTTLEEDSVIEHGVFFRRPFARVEKDMWDGEANVWFRRAKRWFLPRLWNWRIYHHFPKWSDASYDDLAGIYVRELVSPIYFSREVRRAFHKLTNHPAIAEISVWGEIPYKNRVSGQAIEEVAVFKFHDGSTKRIVTPGTFHYYYKHVVQSECV